MAETAQPVGLARWTPSLPTNLVQMLNPFATADDPAKSTSMSEKTNHESEHASHLSFLKRPILSAVTYNTNVSRQSSVSRSSESIMFAEPDVPSPSNSGSRDNSVDGSRRIKRSNRPKTRYSICHPPPASTTRHKLHRRPRPLLQLHRLSATARPLPALEVVPAANFSVRLTRTISKVFPARHNLCPNDIVVLQAESYSGEETDEEQEQRNVVGLICKGRKEDERTAPGRARIHTAHGREWEAYPTPNGGYEFFATDEHGLGLTVRWVPKRYKDESKAPKDGSKTFNFSTISPNTRRHPVIASLSKSSLEINDTYRMPDPAASTPLSTPLQSSSHLTDAMHEESGGNDECETDDQLREIITLTGIWVTFKEGWSTVLKYDDKDKDCIGSGNYSASPIKSTASDRSTPPGSPFLLPVDRRSSIKSISSGILHRRSLLSTSNNRHSIVSAPDTPSRSPSIKAAAATGRARADSSSTVLVHRAASNRRKNSVQTAWRPLAKQDRLPEASREDLVSRKGAADRASGEGKEKTTPNGAAARPLIPATTRSTTSDKPAPSGQKDAREDSAATSTRNGSVKPLEDKKTGLGDGKRKTPKKKRSFWRKMLCGAGSA